MSFVLLGILNSQASGAAGSLYRLQTLGGLGNEAGRSVALDSSDNVYAFGDTTSTGAGSKDFLLAKYGSLTSLEYQSVLGGSDTEEGHSVATDSSNNVYVLGETNSAGAGSNDFLLAKYNSSGTVQWQRTLGDSDLQQGRSVAVDSSDDIYVFGNSGVINDDLDFLLAKYNSSGTLQWQRLLGSSGLQIAAEVATDSSNNVYVIGDTRPGTFDPAEFLLAKYNSSGTIQWQKVLSGANIDRGSAVATDSLDNIYFAGSTNSVSGSGFDFLLAKYNSSGTLQWQRLLAGESTDLAFSVATDSSNNVYVLGETASTGAGSDDFLLAKYNSSGTIQWQRSLGASGNDEGFSIKIDSADNLYLFGITESTGEGSEEFLLAVVPNDGSLTGTYVLDGVNMVYGVSSLTASTPSLTSSTSSFTAETSSLTSSSASLTSASASLAEHRVDLE